MRRHWGSTHSPRDPRQNLPTSPSTDWEAPPSTLPLPQPPRGCASPSESTAAKHVAQGDTTLSPPPVPALATARNQLPKTTRRLSRIHPHFPPRQAPALARLPGATELPPGTTGQRKLCRSHVALGVFLHQTPPEPLHRVPFPTPVSIRDGQTPRPGRPAGWAVGTNRCSTSGTPGRR